MIVELDENTIEFISNFFIILDGEGLSEHAGKRLIIAKTS